MFNVCVTFPARFSTHSSKLVMQRKSNAHSSAPFINSLSSAVSEPKVSVTENDKSWRLTSQTSVTNKATSMAAAREPKDKIGLRHYHDEYDESDSLSDAGNWRIFVL